MAIEDKIVGEVQGRKVLLSEVVSTIQAMGEQGKALRNEEGMKQIGEELLNQELLYLDAVEKKLEEEEEFQTSLKEMKENLLKQYAMQKVLSGAEATDEELQTYFDAHADRYQSVRMRASHILVATEEEAAALLEKIRGGLSFEEAAKAHSSCPSKEKGGDLGSFRQGQMVPEFEEAALRAPIGEVTGPVQTQFGYHLIVVNEREEETRTFDDVKQEVRSQYGMLKQQERYLRLVQELREKYKPEFYM